jgi:hypothetical protein
VTYIENPYEAECHDFIRGLLQQVPELTPAYKEHTRDNESELLPHVFFGDVTRFVQERIRLGSTDEVRRVLSVFEKPLTCDQSIPAPDGSVRNLIEVSFLEILDLDEQVFSALEPLSGPYMKLALEHERRLQGMSPETSY